MSLMIPKTKPRLPKGVVEVDREDFFEHIGEIDLYTRIIDLLHLIGSDEVIHYIDKINGLKMIRNRTEDLIRALLEEGHR